MAIARKGPKRARVFDSFLRYIQVTGTADVTGITKRKMQHMNLHMDKRQVDHFLTVGVPLLAVDSLVKCVITVLLKGKAQSLMDS